MLASQQLRRLGSRFKHSGRAVRAGVSLRKSHGHRGLRLIKSKVHTEIYNNFKDNKMVLLRGPNSKLKSLGGM